MSHPDNMPWGTFGRDNRITRKQEWSVLSDPQKPLTSKICIKDEKSFLVNSVPHTCPNSLSLLVYLLPDSRFWHVFEKIEILLITKENYYHEEEGLAVGVGDVHWVTSGWWCWNVFCSVALSLCPAPLSLRNQTVNSPSHTWTVCKEATAEVEANAVRSLIRESPHFVLHRLSKFSYNRIRSNDQ